MATTIVQQNSLTTTEAPQRVSLLAAMASKYSMEPAAFAATLRATVMPASTTNEQMAAFLIVANEYGLNPITKEIHAFPAKGGGITPVVGIDGWINLAQRRHEFDGMEHEYAHDEKGSVIACTCSIWRKDRSRPVKVTEFMAECLRQTDPWRLSPRRMLRHRATIQAIRYAFGFSGIVDEDDAIVYSEDSHASNVRTLVTGQSKPATATVVEIKSEPTQAEEERSEPTDEWPRANEDGELVDSRGCPWIEAAHSGAKSCNDDGTWRKRKGVDKAVIERLETEAMGTGGAQEQSDDQPQSEPTITLEYVLSHIEASTDAASWNAANKLILSLDASDRQTASDAARAKRNAIEDAMRSTPPATESGASVEQPSQADAQFEEHLNGIRHATSEDEIIDWLESAKEIVGLRQSQRMALEQAASGRRLELDKQSQA